MTQASKPVDFTMDDLAALDDAMPMTKPAPAPPPDEPKSPELQRLLDKPMPVGYDKGNYKIEDLDGLKRTARMFMASGMNEHLLKNLGTDAERLARMCLAIGMVEKLGLPADTGCAHLYVVNGRFAMYGAARRSLVLRNRVCLGLETTIDKRDPANWVATCVGLRRMPDGSVQTVTRTFDVAQAKTAKLWMKKGYGDKDTPWITFPDVMLMTKAEASVLNWLFADLLMGVEDYHEMKDVEEAERAARESATAQQYAGLVEATDGPAQG